MPVVKCYSCHVVSDKASAMLQHEAFGHAKKTAEVTKRLENAASRRCVCGGLGAGYTYLDTDDPKSITKEQLYAADNASANIRCFKCIEAMATTAQAQAAQVQGPMPDLVL